MEEHLTDWVLEVFEHLALQLEEKGFETKPAFNHLYYKTPWDMARRAGQILQEMIYTNQRLVITKIALLLGFASRQGLYKHEHEKTAFAPVVGMIRNIIIAYNEEQVYTSPQAAIFMLKNLKSDYSDKIEQEITQKNINIEI